MYVEISAFGGIRCRVKIQHVWALDSQPVSARCAVSYCLLSAGVNDELRSQCQREMLDYDTYRQFVMFDKSKIGGFSGECTFGALARFV